MLYIMRHATTEWNELGRLQGHTDIPLNEAGRLLALEKGRQYRDLPIDLCYTSPLLRARETARLFLSGKNIPIYTDDRLKEMCFGVCEGTEGYLSDPEGPLGDLFFRPGQYHTPPAGAESMDQLFARTGAFLEQVIKPLAASGKNILIVGHGAMNAALICSLKGLDREHFWDAGLERCEPMKFDGNCS